MTFPLWYLFLPFAAVVLVSALFLFFNLFDMGKYGLQSGKTQVIMLLYVLGFFLILGSASADLLSLDWNTEVSPTDLIPLPQSSSLSNYGL